MTKTRLEAFSDGVIAILITIMVLELHVPKGHDLEALGHALPKILIYLLSFVFVAIYWNNHHHLFHLVDRVSGSILWANLHLLFWLSLTPFTTAWMGDTHVAPLPTATYGAVALFAGVAWLILQRRIMAAQGPDSRVAAAIGPDRKGKASGALYAAAIPLAFVHPAISVAIYASVSLMWLVPDRRYERASQTHHL